MNVTIEFRPAYRSHILGELICRADILVKSDNMDILESFYPTRDGYKQAERFMRLLERGYAPNAARMVNFIQNRHPEKWGEWVEVTAHGEFIPVPLAPEGYVSILDIMVKPSEPLTPDEVERLFQMWLEDGDEIFHFESAYFDDIDIPGLLSYFRALAQAEDEIIAPMHPAPIDDDGSFDGFSHHIGFIPY